MFTCTSYSDRFFCFQTDFPPCEAIEFRCNNSQCIDIELRCDAKIDCLDASDEGNCGKSM